MKSAGICFYYAAHRRGNSGGCGQLLGWAGFAALLFVIVGAWDTFFVDLVLFARWKIFCLKGTEKSAAPEHCKLPFVRNISNKIIVLEKA